MVKEVEEIRFDIGDLRKPFLTEDGTLLCEAVFARDGILEYRDSVGGVRREFRPPDANKSAIAQFGLIPVTKEHPPGLINKDNAEQYRKGMTLQNVRYETLQGKGGFVRGEVAIFDSDLINEVLNGERTELSIGYRCEVDRTPGTWDGQRYDAVQKRIQVNHLAVTKKGRAGQDVRLCLDSAESSINVAYQVHKTVEAGKRKMAVLRIDNAEYNDVPEHVALVVSQKLQELDRIDSIEIENEALEKENRELHSILQSLIEDRDRAQGRSDGLSVVLGNAEEILLSHGYYRDSEGSYFIDGEEEDAEEEILEFMRMQEEEEYIDSLYEPEPLYRSDSIADVKEAWDEARAVAPGIPVDYLDSAETVGEVHAAVVEYMTDMRLDGMHMQDIEEAYELIKEDSYDAEPYSGDLSFAIASARGYQYSSGLSESAIRRMEAYKEPLTFSKAY